MSLWSKWLNVWWWRYLFERPTRYAQGFCSNYWLLDLAATLEVSCKSTIYTETPEHRWQRMRDWVAGQLARAAQGQG